MYRVPMNDTATLEYNAIEIYGRVQFVSMKMNISQQSGS